MANLESKIDKALSAGSGINVRRWKETNYPLGLWKELVAELRRRLIGKPIKIDLTFKNQVKDPAYAGSLTGKATKYKFSSRPYLIEIQNWRDPAMMAEMIAHEVRHIAQWESGDQRPDRDMDKEQDAVSHEHVGREVWAFLLATNRYKPLRMLPRPSEILRRPEEIKDDADWALVDKPLCDLTPAELGRVLELRKKRLL
jgi:hypothetical protein